MPTIAADRLRTIAARLLVGAGASGEEAAIISRHSIGANLAGHDSHGIIQIPTYIDRIERGHIVPGAPVEVLSDTPTTAVVDGNWGFGYVVSEQAMGMAIEKAKNNMVGAVTVFHQSHVGRVARLPSHGHPGGDDRNHDRGLRPVGKVRSPLRRKAAAAGHKPHLHLDAKQPGGPPLPRHGDQRGGRREGRLGLGARRVHSGGVDRRQGTATLRPTRTLCPKAAPGCPWAASRATRGTGCQ